MTGYTTKRDGEGNVILVINFENRPSKEVVVIDGGTNGVSNSSDNEVLQRCWANAKNSPIFWLLPVGILVAVGAPVINQVGGPVKEQLDRINAETANQFQFNNADNNRRPAGNGVKGIEWNNNRNNSGGGQIAAQVNELNRRLGEAFASPQAERAGQIIGVVAALGASAGLLYYWCTNEPSQDGKPLLSSKLSSKEAAPISEENAS